MFGFSEAGLLRGGGSDAGRHHASRSSGARRDRPARRSAARRATQRPSPSRSRPPTSVVQVEQNGALVVDEQITFGYDGVFSGAFREIPLRERRGDRRRLGLGGRQRLSRRAPRRSSARAARPAPSARRDDRRAAADRLALRAPTRRSGRFRIHYRLSGVAVAYDDVVDVNLKVWGDEWQTGLGRLTARLVAPGRGRPRAWGHPVSGARRRRARRPSRRAARARRPGRAVRRAAGARAAPALHVDGRRRRSKRDPASSRSSPRSARTRRRTSATARKIDEALDNLPRTIAILLALALGPGAR